MRGAVRALLTAALACLLPGPAAAVIIATGDGTGNTTAPADDPGFENVGARSGLSVVYIGNHWVLTANHVGVGDVVLGGRTYSPVPGSGHRFANADLTLADLLAFKLSEDPGLPALVVAGNAPSLDELATLIGRGRNRGAPTSWRGYDGWLWGSGSAKRWGTNHVSPLKNPGVPVLDTQAFALDFDAIASPPAGEHESTAANGDSGGAAFIKRNGSWQLAGILFAAEFRLTSAAIYGDVTYAVDLSKYRDDILVVTGQPTCDDGLDDDSDGLVDFPLDPGCADALDDSEHSPLLPCDDGLDNDGDGLIDYPADPECTSPTAPSEAVPVPLLPAPGVGILAALLLGLGAARLSSRAASP